MLLADENTADIAGRLLDLSAFKACHVVAAGEACKTWDTLHGLLCKMEETNLTRKSVLVNFGGGSVSDLGGLAAALFKRGIAVVNVATTLLAAVDAAVGGKTAVNFSGLKNEIGLVRLPNYVIVSLDALQLLSRDEWLSGYGEILKYALLTRGGGLTDIVEDMPHDPHNPSLKGAIKTCMSHKSRVVAHDTEDHSTRHALNLGHTIAHALEALAAEQGRHLPHGVAVGRSLAVMAYISYVTCGLSRKTVAWLRKVCCDNFGLMDYDCKEVDRIIELMRHDKKNTGGKINMVLLSAIGTPEIDRSVDENLIREALDFYM